ncbi:MAG: hypothetical protein U1F36_02115 [Planctomycetota bacterium]
MTSSSVTLRTVSALALFAALAAGQDDAAAAPKKTNPFAEVASKMQALGSLSFKSFEEQDAAMTRRFAKMMPASARETEVNGSRVGDLLGAKLGEDEQEVVIRGERMVARESGGKWLPRRGVDALGTGLPFLFDPAVFFDRLAEVGGDGADLREENTKWREKDCRVITATFTGEAACDLVLGGGLPNVRSMGGMIMLGGGNAHGSADLPELTVDVALWIDTSTGLCNRIKASAYQESEVPGNVQFQVNGADAGDDQPEEKVQERDADGKRIYKSGLPVRGVDSSTSAMHFEVTFSKHGATDAPELDDTARKLLGVAGKR